MERKLAHGRASTAGCGPRRTHSERVEMGRSAGRPRGSGTSRRTRLACLQPESHSASKADRRPRSAPPPGASSPARSIGMIDEELMERTQGPGGAAGDDASPVAAREVRRLGVASSFAEGAQKLSEALREVSFNRPTEASGIIRLEVAIPREGDTIGWLRKQATAVAGEESAKTGRVSRDGSLPDSDRLTRHLTPLSTPPTAAFPIVYFSPKSSTFGEGLRSRADGGQLEDFSNASGGSSDCEVGCVGSTCLWRGPAEGPFTEESHARVSRFLRPGEESVRAYGGIRFDPKRRPAEEWRDFGAYTFLIPSVELRTSPSHSVLSLNVAWDNLRARMEGETIDSIDDALAKGHSMLASVSGGKVGSRAPVDVGPSETCEDPARPRWDPLVGSVLGEMGKMTKLVLARRSRVLCESPVDPLHLLACLQDQDRKGYQFCLLLGRDKAFFGSTPERLYARSGSRVVSEAVAATRRASADSSVTEDLLTSEKEHNEFIVVRDAVKQALESLCPEVEIEVEKQVLKHVSVQHLYGRLSGRITSGKNDFHLLDALHPTPAVAGYPCEESVRSLASMETFDRGFYSGPFGWISGQSSEFAVAIRSALTRSSEEGNELMMYAGVGIVEGSKPALEWKELDLKVQQFTQIVGQKMAPLESFPNTNALVSFLVVEELCRLGVKYFCIAPGSRSTPLVLAAANHSSSEVVTCIDERSLGFFALGLGKANGVPAAVITTSGTAVANLLPAVVEASESGVPLMLLTADRPAEMQGTGANQTIDQMHIYGKFPRWFRNFPAYTPEMPLQMILTNLSTAYRHAAAGLPGPVHLNFQFREPLAPIPQDWDRGILNSKVKAWEGSGVPYTANVSVEAGTGTLAPFEDVMDMVFKCKKGLIVVGTSTKASESLALLEIAERLGWPIVPDISSGLKVGLSKGDSKAAVINNLDHILLDPEACSYLRPDCIIQVGREPVSKRIANFVASSCREGNSKLVMLGNDLRQRDPPHVASHQLALDPVALNDMMRTWSFKHQRRGSSSCEIYRKYLLELDSIASRSVSRCFQEDDSMNEPLIARTISEMIPRSSALYLGNSMPIRDMEFYCATSDSDSRCGPVALGSNRGSSGIDGVTSSAAGFAESLGSPVTLVVGDVSFIHDSNGLNLLSGPHSSKRSPLTTVVVNNNGGRIFEMLPVAKTIESSVLDSCFITSPEADIASLCRAYRIPYQFATNKEDMVRALQIAWSSKVHNVIEIAVDPNSSTAFRSFVRERVKEDIGRFTAQKMFLASDLWNEQNCIQLDRMICEKVTYPLTKEVTTSSKSMVKEMAKFSIHAEHEESGKSITCVGEVSPLPNLHQETFEEARSQLVCVASILSGKRLPLSVVSMEGALEGWLTAIGLRPDTLMPSVRFGLESALVKCASTILGHTEFGAVHVNGLLSSEPAHVLEDAESLVLRGFRGIKLKVGRARVEDDIEMVRLVSERFGSSLILRCDANRSWTLDEALAFAKGVSGFEIEFIEEPVKDLADLKAFCELSSIPVALDEHLSDHLQGTTLENVVEETALLLDSFAESLDAAVLKPAVLGSIEKFKAVVDVCSRRGIKPIVSSTFESSVGLQALVYLARYANKAYGREGKPLLHGLGTIDWNTHEPREGKMLLEEAAYPCELNTKSVVLSLEQPQEEGQVALEKAPFFDSTCMSLDHVATIHEGFMQLYRCRSPASGGDSRGAPPLAFVHGFLGDIHDWMPVISSVAGESDCYAVSLPGHSSSGTSEYTFMENSFSFTSASMAQLLDQGAASRPLLVAYSMGARVALDMVLSSPEKYSGLVVVSSSPGIEDEEEREARAMKDLLLSAQIRETSMQSFLEQWYEQPMFREFRECPQFQSIVSERERIHRRGGIADALRYMSPGIQESLWPKLSGLAVPLCVVCGERDSKYEASSREMCEAAARSPHLGEGDVSMHVVPGVGHCVHLESPEALAPILASFSSHVAQREEVMNFL